MAKINLLPWRLERRKRRQKEFFLMLAGAALVALLLAVVISSIYSSRIEDQEARNAYLNQRIAEVHKQIEEIDALDKTKERLLARKAAIEELQADRSRMVHLFDELVRTIPDGVQLTSIQQTGDRLTLEGLAQSNARVSAYMRNIDASAWLATPDLEIIEAKGENPALPLQFKLHVRMSSPQAEQEGADQTAKAAP